MTSRVPEGSIHRSLARRHHALRRALAIHVALRAAAASASIVALAVVAGLGIGGPGLAWLRVVLVAVAVVLSIAWAVRQFLRRAPGFDAYLETVEHHFNEVRSLLRNAVDFASGPGNPGTSPELAHAVTRDTVAKLEGLPLDRLAPPLRPVRPLASMAAALALLIAGTVIAPRDFQRSWAMLWN